MLYQSSVHCEESLVMFKSTAALLALLLVGCTSPSPSPSPSPSDLEFFLQETSSLMEKRLQDELGEWGVTPAVILSCESNNCDYPLLPEGDEIVKVVVFTPKGVEKWQIQHGAVGETHHVEEGYKLVACYCNQEECLARTPDYIQILTEHLTPAYKDAIRVYYAK